jgi:hypothetical protein
MGEFAVAATSSSLPETTVKVSILRAFGINAIALPLQTASNASFMIVALGGIRILVPSYQLEAALQIFDQADEVEEASTAQAFQSRPIRSGFAVFVQWFLGVPLPVWNRWLRSSEADPPASDGR